MLPGRHDMNSWRSRWICGSILSAAFFFVCVLPLPASPDTTIIVGSKNFLENRLLAEMFAQLIEAQTTLQVERRLGLAGTQICFEALKTGGIDLYPEYTGTGL
ncbi:MAG: glycine betaine ABC transporter substrate-binding protein, partial [Nitrospirota bacterium]|nr:glycine betaine ABC transporter substrate-binding protein [Nitrospirota bacterium]